MKRRKKVDMHKLQELVRLLRMGKSQRRAAHLLSMSRNTVSLYEGLLSEAGLLEGDASELPELDELRRAIVGDEDEEAQRPPQHTSSVEAWAPIIQAKMDRGAKPKAIFDYLRLAHEDRFEGSYWAVKRMCKRLKDEAGVQPEDVAIPVVTKPGKVAQVDFGYVGKLYDPDRGVMRKAWVFVMVLGHSRHMFAEIVFDQRAETWQWLHTKAFMALGGVPEVLVPDNLKAAVIRRAFGLHDKTELNRSYRELARHYGCVVDPTPVRSPEKKGKVESGVKYVKRNFFVPREFADIEQANRELKVWLDKIAGQRTHGTTGRMPAEHFELEERQALNPLPAMPWVPVTWKTAKVHTDCCIVFDKRQYMVPWQHKGETVWVRATPDSVLIYADEIRVATWDRRGKGPAIKDSFLPPERAHLRHRSREYWEGKARLIGEDCADYIAEVFAQDDALSMLRTVQAIVTHLEGFPTDRANAACRRASFYGNYGYRGIMNILAKALDLQPLPPTLFDTPRPKAMRFARSPAEIILNHMENNHGHC
jgi:transposase